MSGMFVSNSATEINNNNTCAKKISRADKMAARMIRRKQSATWRDRYITIQLLNKQSIQISIQPKAKYGEIMEEVCAQLGLTELSIFALAVKSEAGEYRFLDSNAKVCKRLLASSQERNAVPENTTPTKDGCHIYLRVQHYVESGHSFGTEVDKKYYFQQLKENFLRYGFNYPDDRCFLLASYAIHADELNWRDFDPREYFPGWVLKRYGTQFVRKHMPTITPEKINSAQAMNTYIKELCTNSPYAYNMRLHKVQSHKSQMNDTRLGLTLDGIDVYEVNSEGYLGYLTGCQWSDVKTVIANKKRLDVHTSGACGNLIFYTVNEENCICLAQSITAAQVHYTGAKDTNRSFSSIASSLDDLSSFRESYIYSDENDLEWEYEHSVLGTLPFTDGRSGKINSYASSTPSAEYNHVTHGRDRFSIVSTSTTTSGIVSDRTCVSVENSREDLLNDSVIGMREISCDSLLDGSDSDYGKGRTVTVQRAISEPSKKFEQLRLQVTQKPQYLPRRAVSDETVDDHDYENIAVIKKIRAIQMASRRTQSTTSQLSNKSPVLSGQCSPNHHSNASSPRKLSISSTTKLQPPMASPQHRYSLISTSPSMERLLIEYTPPPSYNEAHARQREMIMAAASRTGSQVSLSTSLPASSITKTSHSASNSLTVDHATSPQTKRQSSAPYGETESNNLGLQNASSKEHKCSCQKLSSHPEIDKLRTEDLKFSFPMISALCNDKELQKTPVTCQCKNSEVKPPSPRPISWHCDGPLTFTFPTVMSH